jgi:hypothetical protein
MTYSEKSHIEDIKISKSLVTVGFGLGPNNFYTESSVTAIIAKYFSPKP